MEKLIIDFMVLFLLKSFTASLANPPVAEFAKRITAAKQFENYPNW